MDRRKSRDLIARLNRDAERIAVRFGLRYRSIEAERANVKRRYGICYDDGTIRIRLRHVTTGKPLKYSSLVNTLCHELAHLRHFNHGPQFKEFYLGLLEWARREGIYQPGPRVRAAASERPPPRQGSAWPQGSGRGIPTRTAQPKPERAAPSAAEQLDLFSRGI